MIIAFFIIILILGIILLAIFFAKQKNFSLPVGDVMYGDSGQQQGDFLSSTSIPLSGRPDYIIRKGKYVIPVEIKRGKTPASPYRSHMAQLYAYCLLIEENFHTRPPYGVIQYPEKEFILEYPKEVELRLKRSIEEILMKKQVGLSRKGLTNICRNCRINDHEHMNK